ncbi:alpha/beta hydrolase family protein [Portibacter lacus]|uniref:BD-FAE-like domain-containing protein n=1 Tax=Portibacter lacus TaxID=1099794 RepID=A0AA37SR21_9BACT|nr:prolyl oligopeptidase family serine peptidase [Portibacter lacus]GLR18124.1 hypothetical protein GCM10007940_27390 [Portibacter lacus]
MDSAEVRAGWNNIQLEAENSVVEKGYSHLNIVYHGTLGQGHYTAYFLPMNYDEQKKYPTLVWLNGLNQVDPSVFLEHDYFERMRIELSDYIIIVPSFRGQALVYRNKKYCSDGFFGDAYDGAATDGLRALNLGKKLYPIDESRIAVAGQSRGGTVALLMAARDSMIRTVVDITGPVDFYDKRSYYRYGKQFKYQFLSQSKNLKTIRHKMIASSPIYFLEDYKHPILIVYGKSDRVVPIENAEKLILKLKGRDYFEAKLLNRGHDIRATKIIFDWLKIHNN